LFEIEAIKGNMAKEYHFHWIWDLASSPEQLWSMACDTNRFNKDTWQPPMEMLGIEKGVRQVRFRFPFSWVNWEEEPFEWIFPNSFGVDRRYKTGPLIEMRIETKLEPRANGGTRVLYDTMIKPVSFLLGLVIPFGIGFVARHLFERAFRKYDQVAAAGGSVADTISWHALRGTGLARFNSLIEGLIKQGTDAGLILRLREFLDRADDLSLQHIRPYALADRWHTSRRPVLEMFLRATRAGILDMSWELLCPSCRGVAESSTNLGKVHATSHCKTCNIDFTANFDHNVEIIFQSNPAIRSVDNTIEFCVGSPQRQPHIVMMQTLWPREEMTFSTELDAGRYTVKASGLSGSRGLVALRDGAKSLEVLASPDGWPYGEAHVSLTPRLRLLNITQEPHTIQIERTVWSDQAATAADVTTLQVFRDLFATEVLRPGEELSIGSVTLMFTDLLDSTRLYRQIGDPSAFGRVRDHFVVLESAIAAEGGAIIKTMGDSVMAAFRTPAASLKAIMRAQKTLATGDEGLWLKIGIHHGSCIVVNLNDRLDYFGSTVNIAARLPDFSNGGEVIFSEAIRNDPEVKEFLEKSVQPNTLTRFSGEVKGYEEAFPLWRLKI
jgi:class 3 adenylate cyclase